MARVILQWKCSPFWSYCQRVSVVSQWPHSLHGGERISLLRQWSASALAGTALSWLLSAGFIPLRAEFLPFSELNSICGSSQCGEVWQRQAGDTHGWAPQPGLKWLWPTEEQLCYRRNTEWERVDRNRYGHKLGLCFQKCKVFPPDSHCGSRNMNWKWLCVPQMSGRNCYLFFHQDFAFWVLLFPSMLARSKIELSLNPLKSETIHLQIWAH